MTLRFRTPPCIQCHETSYVELTEEEFDALQRPGYIQTALPDRDADFRELVKTGIHPECWDAMFTGEEME
jgi:hypothetical protein